MIWRPEPIWSGAACFILGGGPSLDRAVVDRLRGRHVIAINCAYRLAPWAEILFFNDRPWAVRHRSVIETWSGMAVTTSRVNVDHLPANVMRVQLEHRTEFPAVGSGIVRDGRSSGHKSIGLAVALGCATIGLVGFDMRTVEGWSHFHDEYRRPPALYAESFVPAFRHWDRAARDIGVTIINCTPGSALQEFRFANLDEVLQWA